MHIFMQLGNIYEYEDKRTPAQRRMWQGLVKRRLRGVKGARIRVSVWAFETS